MTTFSTLLLLSALTATDDAVLVQFTSDQCGACRTMQPTIARLIEAGYQVQTINIDQQPEYGRQFRIQGLPTYVLMVKGRERDRVCGAAGYDKLTQLFGGMQPDSRPPMGAIVRGQSPEGHAHTDGHIHSGVPANSVPDRAPPQWPPARLAQTQFAAAPPSQSQVSPAPGEAVFPASFTASAPPQQTRNVTQLALQATVRLKVEDETGFGCGTGTVIDVHDTEALIVTCGHLFRASQGKGKIAVELFAEGISGPIAGQLLAYDLDRDIALVSVRPGVKITAVQVAPEGYAVRPRDGVFTLGCDKGADPTVRESHVTAVNKYQGPPNFTVAGQPVDGRSGGGLFSAEGYLVGICNAADPQDNEGLYAALSSIHWQLDQLQLSEIHRRARPTPAAQDSTALAAAAPLLTRPSQIAVSQPAVPQMPSRPFEPVTPTARPTSAATSDAEVIVIVRSRSNPQQASEVYSLDSAPPELLARIAATGRRNLPASQPGYADQPVVRGQSGE